ncbi:hypothetical protein evm_007530 [Chilo suppressalis]|nr:hypothetical protein evm_007530 [Chilo suppressalis]
MAAVLRLFMLFAVLYGNNVTGASISAKPDGENMQLAESNNGFYGVASVAGITSRNGRISSLGGIQIYPGTDSSVRVTNEGVTFYHPSTNNAGGNFATGSIGLLGPGSVLVSSTAGSGDIKPLPLSINVKKSSPPLLKEFVFQPLPDIFEKARNFQPIEPWFTRNVYAFNPPKLPSFDAWVYPNFNQLFSFWR